MSSYCTSTLRRAGCIVALAAGLSFVAAQSVTIAETGSTLIYPLFNAWIAAYANVDPNVHMTAGATGSGAFAGIIHRIGWTEALCRERRMHSTRQSECTTRSSKGTPL